MSPIFRHPQPEAPSLAARFMQALALQRKGQLELAFEHYGAILTEFPHHVGSHINCGIVLHLLGEHDRALAALGRAVQLEPENADALYNYAKVLAALDRGPEALAHLSKSLELKPGELLTLREICRLTLKLGHYDEFFGAVSAGLEAHPQDAVLYLLKAEAYIKQGDFSRATDLLNLLLHNDPSLEGALVLLSEAYLQTRRVDKAVACVKRALLKNPDSAELHKRLGICYSVRGDRDLARGELERARELDPSLIVTLEGPGGAREESPERWDALQFQSYILARSDHYARTGSWRGAINEFLLLARKYQDRPIIWQELASAYQNAGEHLRAYTIYRKVLQMEPGNLEVQLQLSRLALTIGRLAEARKLSETSAAAFPEVSEVAELQGQVCLEANDLAGAKSAFSRALERSPSNLDALMGLGACHFRAGELHEAREVWEQAHKAYPQSIRLALSLATAYCDLGQKVAAIKLLRETKAAAQGAGRFVKLGTRARALGSQTASSEVIAAGGSPIELVHRLGGLYLECGWPKKARTEWRGLLEMWNGDLREGARVFEALVFFREVREALRVAGGWLKKHRPTPELDFLMVLCHAMQRDQTRFWIAWQKVWKEQPSLLEARANFLKAVLNRSDVHFLLSQMPRTQALFSGFPETMQRITALEEYLGRIQAIEPVTELSL